MAKSKVWNWIFWAALSILIIDLASYYKEIGIYFTPLGQILLFASVIFIILSKIVPTLD